MGNFGQGPVRAALGGRTARELAPLLTFLVRYATHPRYADTILDTAEPVETFRRALFTHWG